MLALAAENANRKPDRGLRAGKVIWFDALLILQRLRNSASRGAVAVTETPESQ